MKACWDSLSIDGGAELSASQCAAMPAQRQTSEATMKCEFLLTYHADLAPAVEVGGGPFGTRVFFEVKGGTFEGPRLRGKILSGGGDWLLIDAQGVARLDVRAVFETDDPDAMWCVPPWNTAERAAQRPMSRSGSKMRVASASAR
jgi:hypothetical protein